jgi:hypothetical protein
LKAFRDINELARVTIAIIAVLHDVIIGDFVACFFDPADQSPEKGLIKHHGLHNPAEKVPHAIPTRQVGQFMDQDFLRSSDDRATAGFRKENRRT